MSGKNDTKKDSSIKFIFLFIIIIGFSIFLTYHIRQQEEKEEMEQIQKRKEASQSVESDYDYDDSNDYNYDSDYDYDYDYTPSTNTTDYSNSYSSYDDGGKRKTEAWVCSQDIVDSYLKSPSTAEYCWYNEDNVTWNGGSDYTVNGYVDAENGFGATVRTYFTVTLTLTENGYTNGYATFN